MSIHTESQVRMLCRYPIASADMYYSELGQREVYACDDPRRGFRIWGELSGAGETSAISLIEVFLEYAMLCQSLYNETEAYYQMESFGKGLGEAAALYIQENVLGQPMANPGACALECVLESMNANFTVGQVGPELRFLICECPFEEIASRTGLPQSELPHVGINAMCQSLLHSVEPEAIVSSPYDERMDHIFAMTTEVLAQV